MMTGSAAAVADELRARLLAMGLILTRPAAADDIMALSDVEDENDNVRASEIVADK